MSAPFHKLGPATRRTLFGAALALVGFVRPPAWGEGIPHGGENPPHGEEGIPVTETPSPDAGLIYLCERIVRRHQRANRDYDRGYDAAKDLAAKNVLLNVLVSQQETIDDMIEVVADIPATTPEGRAAKADVLRVWVGVYRDNHMTIELNGTATAHEKLVWSLADDFIGGAG